MTRGRIDVHFHIIPDFYEEVVYAAGSGPSMGRYPYWSPERSIELFDAHGIETAITSMVAPGVQFIGEAGKAAAFARRCNDYSAELNSRWPTRFGAFGLLPLHDIDAAIAEARYCLETLKFEGVFLFTSYGDRYLGDPYFEPLFEYLNEKGAVVHVHPIQTASAAAVKLPYPHFIMEYVFDTTRAAVNLLFSGALERHPRIKFILSHAGGVAPYIAWRVGAAPMMYKAVRQLSQDEVFAGLKKFWYDTALSAGATTFGTLMQVADPAKVVFGSDWPMASEQVVAAAVKELGPSGHLEPAAQQTVARTNALVLFPGRA